MTTWVRVAPPDGLEAMLVSLAIDTRINMIFSDTMCTTAAEGIDFSYLTIVWATVGVLLCCVFDPEAGIAVDVDMSCTSSTTPDEEHVLLSLARRNIGQPMVKIPELMEKCNSSDTETDPE